jgi:hypothetical protein
VPGPEVEAVVEQTVPTAHQVLSKPDYLLCRTIKVGHLARPKIRFGENRI